MDADQILGAVRSHIDGGVVPGAVVGVLHVGEASVAAAGTTGHGVSEPLRPETVMRISSNTKPIVAALALTMVEDGTLSLDLPIEAHVPELADRLVLRRPDAALDDTVPARRPITISDLLTMRMGFGYVLDGPSPAVAQAAEAGLGLGPPDPSAPLSPDEWIARLAALPLLEQPGTAWRYEISFAVLGVLLARASGRPLDVLLRERVLEPLGMADTGFRARPDSLPPAYLQDDEGASLFDAGGAGSRWTVAPVFPDARGGLVSTAGDLLRFASALLDGRPPLLKRTTVEAMTTDALTPEQSRAPSAAPFLDGGGWGYGVGVAKPGTIAGARYGWGGGLGTLWWSYPAQRTAAVLLTQVMPPVTDLFDAFTAAVETILYNERTT